MRMIIGLGNPGKEYENTRHNIGFMVIDNYLKENSWQKKYNALYTVLNINGEKIYFIKPQTYMNLSGQAVKEFVNFFKIDINNILIIHDDLDLEIGKYRIKTNSSAGGHNGIKSIIESLGTNKFARLKIGISHNKNSNTKNYVLGKFKNDEQLILEKLYPIFNDIITAFLTNSIDSIMNKYNRK